MLADANIKPYLCDNLILILNPIYKHLKNY